MRNLKRVLCLALAATMLMGMMVMGAGAAESKGYTDAGSITKNEAVDVMSAIGVFQGTNDNVFNPAGDLTRETAAKIITYMLMGKKAADDLKTSVAPFKDVAANRWSAGSIAYCVANGIVAGDGQGNFFPEVKVTGHQFGKMLLTALGYKAETEGYVGTGWELNVAKQIQTLKLGADVGVGMSNVLNREQAAQMAFNTLDTVLVEYVGGTNVKLPDGTTVISGGTRQVVKDGAGAEISFRDNYFPNLDSTTFTGEVFGRPAHQWKNGATKIGEYSNSTTVVYTETTKKSVIESDLSGYTYGVVGGKAIVNGVAGATIANAQNLADVTGTGRLVEVYTAKVGTTYTITNVVVVDTFFAQINTINTASKMVTLDIDAGSTANFGAAAVTLKKDNNEALYATLSAMEADDYVLLTAANGAIRTVSVPETVTGTVKTITKDGDYVVDGTTYKVTKGVTPGAAANGTAYVIYLDTYGNVIGAVAEKDAATKNAFLLAVEKTGAASSDSVTYSAKLLFEDGTIEWVKVTTLNSKGVKDAIFTDDFITTPISNIFVAYSAKSDGSYALTKVNMAGSIPGTVIADTAKANGYTFTTGKTITKSTVEFLSGSDLMGSGKTVFLVKNSSGSYKSYTGINSISNLSVSGLSYVLVGKNSTTASVVVVDATATAKDLVYILSNDYSSGYDSELSQPVYTYEAVVKGEITTITSTVDTLGRGLYTIDSYNDTYAATLTLKAGVDDARRQVVGTVTDNFVHAAKSDLKLKIASGTVMVPTTTNAKNYVLAEKFTIIGVNSADGEAMTFSASNLDFYTANGNTVNSAVLVFDSNGFVTSVTFVYTLAP